jgi:hypothetical protein
MPVATENTVSAFAFCPDGRCAGYELEPVDVIHTHTTSSYNELGGDLGDNFVERSHDYYRFSDPADIACPHCDRERGITADPRPEYAKLHPGDPKALLQLGGEADRLLKTQHAVELQEAKNDARVAELTAQVAQLTALVQSQQEAPKRGRKPVDEAA